MAAEVELATVGYRDRLFIELVTNAADAAAQAQVGGEVSIWRGPGTVHIANTGAPLSVSGVQSLLALRVSAKTGDDGAVIGRFGVGFSATAAVARAVEIRSRSGSIGFDIESTAQALNTAGISTTVGVPLLRLAWPIAAAPREGFDTEVVLRLADDVDAYDLVSGAVSQAADLLLALPALRQISFDGNDIRIDRTPRREVDGLSAGAQADDVVIIDESSPEPGAVTRTYSVLTHGSVQWVLRRAGAGIIADERDVVWAPTPTDIELSVPCRLIARLALTHDRRHLHPDADLLATAAGYPDLMALVAPADRLALVPLPHRARGRDDARLIDAIVNQLRERSWLPVAANDAATLVPRDACVLIGLTADLAAVLGDAFGDLIHPDLSQAHHLRVLDMLGVSELGLAALAERLTGVNRPPEWWRRLYQALEPLVGSRRELDELAALPIPRSDGKMNIGARGLFSLPPGAGPARWIHTVDSRAEHVLLERLGVEQLSVQSAIDDPLLKVIVDEASDAASDDAADAELADVVAEVLTVVAADPVAVVPEWLMRLPLHDESGEWRSADELLLADSPLAGVLVADHPFGLVAEEFVTRFGSDTLRRIGVGWRFSVVDDEFPVAPDHELPDEEQWWDSLAQPPERLTAVRDLDLVDPTRWEQALALLAGDDAVAAVLADRSGYTAWWLRHFAEIANVPLGEYRAPSDSLLTGVFDPLDHPSADSLAAALAVLPPESAAAASTLLARVGHPDRAVSAGVARAVYRAVVGACRTGVIDAGQIDEPEYVRAVSGESTGAVVLDHPWWVQVIDPDDLVVGPADPDDATLLADILDLPVASEEYAVRPQSPGDPATSTSSEAVLFAAATGYEPSGDLRLHDDLVVLVRHQASGEAWEVRVRWWVDEGGTTHLPRGG